MSNIGYYLKTIRQKKQITLNEVALALDITASMLSQIENNKTQPSISSLSLILEYYQINISDFFKQLEKPDYLIVKQKDLEIINDPKEGFSLSLMASKLESNALETYLIEINPESKLELLKQITTQNKERVIIVIRGELNIEISKKKYILKEMDSINYKAYEKVLLLNENKKEKTKLILVGNPPLL